MSRPSINNLPIPSARWIKRILRAGLETMDDAKTEDAFRIWRLQSPTVIKSELLESDWAANLALRLQLILRSDPSLPTLASRVSMRTSRLKVTAALGEFLERENTSPYVSFTILSKQWNVAPANLLGVSAKRLLRAFRADLDRCGGTQTPGSLFAAIDLEFEPHRSLFVLHIHGVASGGMIAALDRLRQLRKYRPVRKEQAGAVPLFRPIVVKKINRRNVRPLTYLLKSYWTSTWRGEVQEDGKFRTARISQRIPEPYHSLALLWFHQHSLKDITLLMGMEAGPFGIRRSSPCGPRSGK